VCRDELLYFAENGWIVQVGEVVEGQIDSFHSTWPNLEDSAYFGRIY
jgi:hypothetical protein